MRVKNVRLMLIIIVTMFFLVPRNISGQEETGAVIRQLVQKVHDDMNAMESEINSFASDKGKLLVDLERLTKQLEKTRSEEDEKQIAASMGVVLAKLNRIDREKVDIVKKNILNLRPTMKTLKNEYKNVARMGHSTSKEFQTWRVDMGTMLTNFARLLHDIKSSLRTSDSDAEISHLENTLILMFASLGEGMDLNYDSGKLIDEQIQILDDAYSQIYNISVLLEQERLQLKMLTYSEIVNAVMTYFSTDEFSKVSDTPTLLYDSIGTRSNTIATLANRSQRRINSSPELKSPINREQILERMRNGDFDWGDSNK